MNRRDWLSAIAALPFINKLMPQNAAKMASGAFVLKQGAKLGCATLSDSRAIPLRLEGGLNIPQENPSEVEFVQETEVNAFYPPLDDFTIHRT